MYHPIRKGLDIEVSVGVGVGIKQLHQKADKRDFFQNIMVYISPVYYFWLFAN